MSKANDEMYFNFPINLLKGFLINSDKCLEDVVMYALWAHTEKLVEGDPKNRFKSSLKYFGVTYSNIDEVYNLSIDVYFQKNHNSVKVGISVKTLLEYRNSYKSEFEKACLLAFLAIKSIMQTKPYCKIDNAFLWSRMDGNSKSIDASELSDEIKVYANRYQIDKIKKELIINWHLIYYSRHTRGFYISFKLKLNDLILEAEKKRKSVKEKQLKQAQDEALKWALERLNSSPP